MLNRTLADESHTVGVGASADVQLSLVPRFQLRCEGVPVILAPSSERLVAYLALQPGPVRREQASAILWPCADEHHAGGGLRTALWRLPRMPIVMASRTHLALHPGLVVDLHQLNVESLALLHEEDADYRLADTASRLISAEGGVLADYADDWVIDERERFRQLWLQAMDKIGDLLIGAGRCSRAIHVALVTTRAEPLRESAYRVLIRAHAMQGNLAEAIREYRQYADRLRTELNVCPSWMMRELVASCLADSTPSPHGASQGGLG